MTLDTAKIPHACSDCPVRTTGVCAALNPAELNFLSEHSRHTSHEADEPLTSESDEVTGFATVVQGVVKLSRLLSDGRQQLVGLQFPADLVGRIFGRESPVSIDAGSQVELCRTSKSTLEELAASSPALKQRLLEQSLRELDDAREWMVTLGRKTATERVATLLFVFAHRAMGRPELPKGRAVFDLPLTRADMADFLGLTIETVSRQMTALRKRGLIEIVGYRHISVADIQRLERLAM